MAEVPEETKIANSELVLKIALAIAKTNQHLDPEAYADEVQKYFDSKEE